MNSSIEEQAKWLQRCECFEEVPRKRLYQLLHHARPLLLTYGKGEFCYEFTTSLDDRHAQVLYLKAGHLFTPNNDFKIHSQDDFSEFQKKRRFQVRCKSSKGFVFVFAREFFALQMLRYCQEKLQQSGERLQALLEERVAHVGNIRRSNSQLLTQPARRSASGELQALVAAKVSSSRKGSTHHQPERIMDISQKSYDYRTLKQQRAPRNHIFSKLELAQLSANPQQNQSDLLLWKKAKCLRLKQISKHSHPPLPKAETMLRFIKATVQFQKKEKQQMVRPRGKQQMNSPINKDSFMSPPSKQCMMMNSPNKENYIGSANQALSPVVNHALQSPIGGYQSPGRTTSSEALQCLRSNKSKEPLQDNANETMLFSGLSKDGKYRVESRTLEGAELERAVEQQKKTALRTMLSSGREKGKAPQFQHARVSSKANGAVKAYAINTHSGISRNYNEDRVSVTLNIKKQGKRAQFFAIYDGHGGSHCCDYLKDTLHQLVISHTDFPSDPRKALHEAIQQAQANYCDSVRARQSRGEGLEKSGSCALILLLVQDCCYIANVGDSRAILSTENGRVAFNLSRDHRPLQLRQQQRIIARGGKVYRTEMNRILTKKQEKVEKIIGPLRVYPGRLSVTRTLGDIQAKDPQFGGMRGVISAEPEIRKFRLTGKQDFILLCCDGVLERMQSMQVVETAWSAMKKQGSVHEQAGKGVDAVLKESMRRKSSDNQTAIMICLSELALTHAS